MKEQPEKINLPPFYDGQKVVFVGPSGGGETIIPRGSVCTVSTCVYEVSSNPINVMKKKFWYVGIVECHNGQPCLSPTIFIPLQQKEFPALTFSEIAEAEKLEALLSN